MVDSSMDAKTAPGAAWRWPALAALLVIVAIGAFWSQRLGTAFAFSYDEGVYLTSARELLHGERLGVSVFSSQPPGLVEAVARAFVVFGDSKLVARGLMLALGLCGLAFAALLAGLLGGRWAAPFAAAALGLSWPAFHAARAVEAEGPAIVLALGAVALLLLSRRRASWPLLVLAGVAWGFGISMKFLPAVWALPLVALCGVELRGPGRWRVAALKGALLRAAVLALVGAAALALTFVRHPLGAVWDQTVAFHLRAAQVYQAQTLGNLRHVGNVLLAHPALVVLGLAGLVVLWRASRPAALWLGAWFALSALMLVAHNPLYSHHLVLLFPPLAVAAGCGGAAALRARRLALPLTGVCVALLLVGSPIRRQLRELGRPADAQNRAVLALIAQHSGPDDVVVSDEPMQVYESGRRTAPPLTDTSVVRIRSGYLTGPQAIWASESARVIVFWRGRLSNLPGYKEWVTERFDRVRSFGQGRLVWVRKPAAEAERGGD